MGNHHTTSGQRHQMWNNALGAKVDLIGFKEVKRCKGWYINEEGKVWSEKSKKFLSPHTNGIGYKQLVYTSEGKRKKHYIHRLVVENFIGEIPPNRVVNHIDGNPQNNLLNNLEIITQKQNNLHAIENNLKKKWRGQSHQNSKLTEDDVLEIRRRREDGEPRSSISQDFDICEGTVSDIFYRKSWAWLSS